jgi:hypothetical protein
MQPKRVRHHTDDEGLEGIRRMEALKPARGSLGFTAGVHVEVEPFGAARPGIGGPAKELGAFKEGAYVEFDAPPTMLPNPLIGQRNAAFIPIAPDEVFYLRGLNPRYV